MFDLTHHLAEKIPEVETEKLKKEEKQRFFFSSERNVRKRSHDIVR